MRVKINGEQREVQDGLTISQLLEEMGIEGQRVIVQHNDDIPRREQWGEVVLKDGDLVEIVTLVGGG